MMLHGSVVGPFVLPRNLPLMNIPVHLLLLLFVDSWVISSFGLTTSIAAVDVLVQGFCELCLHFSWLSV